MKVLFKKFYRDLRLTGHTNCLDDVRDASLRRALLITWNARFNEIRAGGVGDERLADDGTLIG